MTGFSMRSGGFSHAKYLNPLPQSLVQLPDPIRTFPLGAIHAVYITLCHKRIQIQIVNPLRCLLRCRKWSVLLLMHSQIPVLHLFFLLPEGS